MATSASTLIQRTRRVLDDWPELDVLTASLASGGTTLTIADGTRYPQHTLVEIDQEAMRVTATGTGTSASVQRAIRGSTAVSHANGATVLISPRFFSTHILDELNAALDACSPRLYKPVSQEYTLSTQTYEYTLPNMTGLSVPIPYVTGIEFKEPGDTVFQRRREWEVERSATPILKFRSALTSGGTIRIRGFGPFAHLSAVTDTLDAFFPVNAEPLLPLYAAAALLDTAEARRVRQEIGALDSREAANAVGSSSRQGTKLQQRFYALLRDWSMSPPAKPKKYL